MGLRELKLGSLREGETLFRQASEPKKSSSGGVKRKRPSLKHNGNSTERPNKISNTFMKC